MAVGYAGNHSTSSIVFLMATVALSYFQPSKGLNISIYCELPQPQFVGINICMPHVQPDSFRSAKNSHC